MVLAVLRGAEVERLEDFLRAVEGEGLRTESYAFRGEQTDSAPVLTATLTNSVASYPAGA